MGPGQQCPYCGGEDITDPVDLLKDGREEYKALGLKPVMIQKCRGCSATLSPKEFTPGTDEFRAARARKARS